MLQTRHKPRLPLAGSATLDQDSIMVTAMGALQWARANMPRDLRHAGFIATVTRGKEAHQGRYRPCWRVCYGK